MVFCSACGTEYTNGEKFCPQDGTALAVTVTTNWPTLIAELKRQADDGFAASVRTLHSMIEAILQNPDDTSKRRIRLSHPKVLQNVSQYRAAVALLTATGFVTETDSQGEKRAVLSASAPMEPLRLALNALEEAVPRNHHSDMTLALRTAINSFDPASKPVAIATLSRVVSSVLDNPGDLTYRMLRLSNENFHRRLGRFPAAIAFLETLGFISVETDGVSRLELHREDIEKFRLAALLLQRYSRSAPALNKAGSKAVNETVPSRTAPQSTVIRPKDLTDMMGARPKAMDTLDKQLRTLKSTQQKILQETPVPERNPLKFPSGAPLPNLMPSGGGTSEVGLLVESLKRKEERHERESNFRTGAMRELEALRERPFFAASVIRIMFPDGTGLQGTFHAQETVDDVYKFVASCLRHPSSAFSLFQTPPRMTLKRETKALNKADLVPAAKLHFSPGREQECGQPIIHPDVPTWDGTALTLPRPIAWNGQP